MKSKLKIDKDLFYTDDDFDINKVQDRYPLIEEFEDAIFEGYIKGVSIYFSNTPKSLYRFLYIWQPENINFSHMYKSVVAYVDLNGTGVAVMEFYKYQFAVYFYVPEREIKPQSMGMISVNCGVPGTEHNQFVEGSQAKLEFDRFVAILEAKHDVYTGNNFVV
jgi:hypothetical protein